MDREADSSFTENPNALANATTGRGLPGVPSPFQRMRERPDDLDDDVVSETELQDLNLANRLAKMQVNPATDRFFGKSSGVMLIARALDLKNEFTGTEPKLRPPLLPNKRKQYWEMNPVSNSLLKI